MGLTEWRGLKRQCVFCLRRGFDLIYEDAQLVAFADARPRARHHLLVVPREHIELRRGPPYLDGPVDLRGATGAAMLRRMQCIGHKLLDEAQHQDVKAGVAEAHSERVVGFHLPPFNSVAHLHLHCLGLPFTPWWQRARFLPHLGTFATVETVLQQVERAADSAP